MCDKLISAKTNRTKKGGPRMNRFCHIFSQLLQLGHAHSLREITQGLRTCEGKVIHLGMTAP